MPCRNVQQHKNAIYPGNGGSKRGFLFFPIYQRPFQLFEDNQCQQGRVMQNNLLQQLTAGTIIQHQLPAGTVKQQLPLRHNDTGQI